MSGRQTYIDYADTPATERTATFPGAYESDDALSGARSPASITHKPSVTIGAPRDPIVRKGPADGDEDEEPVNPTSPVQSEPSANAKSNHRRSTSLADSGYGSAAPESKPQRSASRASTNIAPLPVVWTNKSPSQNAHQRGQAMSRSLDTDGEETDDDDDGEAGARPTARRNDTGFRRAASLRSFRSAAEERASVRTTPSVRRRRVSLSGGSFAGGAGTVGPAASTEMDEEFDARSRSAEASLSPKQRAKLNKAQMKEGKKVAKIIKAEGKAEKKALDDAVRELAGIQKLQKSAVKEEGKTYAAYSKMLRDFRKVELEFLAMKAKYERAQAELQAFEEAREMARQHAQEATEMLQEKNKEVEWLRAQKAVDDRERVSKIKQLTGKA